MAKPNTVKLVEEIISPYAKELGLEIWDVRFAKEGSEWYLRIFIDKEGGVSIDDCVDLTHAISKPLDEKDPISQSYMLEVARVRFIAVFFVYPPMLPSSKTTTMR